ncbi:MAG: hypothetical protein ABSG78_02460 [Verrucomicrobiota bacterium]|jgi:hypothetical protein
MKTITLKLPVGMAEQMIEFLEARRLDLQRQLQSVEIGIRSAKEASPKPGIVVAPPQPTAVEVLRSLANARIPETNPPQKHGMAKDAVISFMKSRNGAGFTVKEIQADAKVSYGSAYRYLHLLREEKRVKEGSEPGLWLWVG